VSEPEAISAAIREAHERAPIDILICNAGIIIPGHFDDVSTKDLEETVTTNVLGSLYPIHAAIPLMKQRCGPNTPQSIVLVSSVAGLVSYTTPSHNTKHTVAIFMMIYMSHIVRHVTLLHLSLSIYIYIYTNATTHVIWMMS
jgi:NAD(P)-dependent dehydrogenase (short-subunit alcohol dehydrogenase family)